MSWLSRLFGGSSITPVAVPRVQNVMTGPGVTITNAAELEAYMISHGEGGPISETKAMRVAAVNRCNAIISDYVATTSVDVMKDLAENKKEVQRDHSLHKILKKKPNRWQTPLEYKRMMQSFVNFRGNAYALKVVGGSGLLELLPLHPDRVEVKQDDNLRLWYIYSRKNGGKERFPQEDIHHLRGLSFDGITGVSILTAARKSIELSLTMETHGQALFANGASPKMVLTHPALLSEPAYLRLKQSIDEQQSGPENAGKTLILEEGLVANDVGLTNEDAQWIETRRFSRTDIAMFFGVPPHMIGETDKSTSWGTGIEAQETGFRIYTGEGHLVMWEEALKRDCLDEETEADLYVKFNRMSRARADLRSRWETYVKGLQWGVLSPDEVRAFEDMNPRPDGQGGIYYPPPNTANAGQDEEEESPEDEPPEEDDDDKAAREKKDRRQRK